MVRASDEATSGLKTRWLGSPDRYFACGDTNVGWGPISDHDRPEHAAKFSFELGDEHFQFCDKRMHADSFGWMIAVFPGGPITRHDGGWDRP
jgi:hypothetical protein